MNENISPLPWRINESEHDWDLSKSESKDGATMNNAKHTHPAPSVPADVVRDAIAAVREQYRGTDWGKAAECICDAIDAAIEAAKEK